MPKMPYVSSIQHSWWWHWQFCDVFPVTTCVANNPRLVSRSVQGHNWCYARAQEEQTISTWFSESSSGVRKGSYTVSRYSMFFGHAGWLVKGTSTVGSFGSAWRIYHYYVGRQWERKRERERPRGRQTDMWIDSSCLWWYWNTFSKRSIKNLLRWKIPQDLT